MKNISFTLILYAALIVSLVLVSCQPQAQTPAQQQNHQQEQIIPPTPNQQIPAETKPLFSPNISEETKQLLLNKEKIVSYVYSFGELNQRNTYSVMGDKIKINLLDKPVKAKDQYDTVYLDNKEKKAYGTCEKCDLRLKYRIVDYQQYKLTSTPLDIFDDIQQAEVVSAKKKIVNDRDTILVKINNSRGTSYEAYVDQFFAFPHEITIILPSGEKKVVQYFGVKINSLTDEDVTLPPTFTLIES